MADETGPGERAERRGAPRHTAAFRAELDDGTIGWTRDVGPTGVFVLLPADFSAAYGAAIRIRLRLDELDPDRPAWVTGIGHIVRFEHLDASTGLAIAVEDWSVGGPAGTDPD